MAAMDALLTSLCPIAIVTTTVATAEDAQRLAQCAVQVRKAACAQVERITSHYEWEGQLAHSAEWRVVFKTVPQRAPALWAWLQAAHPYEVPQLLLRREYADAAYTAWVAQQVQAEAI